MASEHLISLLVALIIAQCVTQTVEQDWARQLKLTVEQDWVCQLKLNIRKKNREQQSLAADSIYEQLSPSLEHCVEWQRSLDPLLG